MSDDCGSPCATGPGFPRPVWNRPGLPSIGYRIGAYDDFRAELLRRLDRRVESVAAYDRAIALAGNTAETAHLSRRRDELAT